MQRRILRLVAGQKKRALPGGMSREKRHQIKSFQPPKKEGKLDFLKTYRDLNQINLLPSEVVPERKVKYVISRWVSPNYRAFCTKLITEESETIVKKSTRKELYQKLTLAKNIIKECDKITTVIRAMSSTLDAFVYQPVKAEVVRHGMREAIDSIRNEAKYFEELAEEKLKKKAH